MSTYTGVTNFQKTVRFWPTLYDLQSPIRSIAVTSTVRKASLVVTVNRADFRRKLSDRRPLTFVQ